MATRNAGKQAEFQALFAAAPFGESGLSVAVRDLDELGFTGALEETGHTFAENAALKARTVMQATGLPALADDSGLEVDALHGAPGVYSARWAGAVSAAERNALLLQRLIDVPDDQRGARFVCVIAICHPSGASAAARGDVSGRLLRQALGEGGFGYDPLFFLPALARTYAQLSPEEKNTHSHRAQAFAGLRPLLPAILS